MSVPKEPGATATDGATEFILVEFAHRQCVRPADTGESSDIRSIAVGFRQVEVWCAQNDECLGRFSFCTDAVSKPYILYGTYAAEDWGAWSSGRHGAIVLPVARKGPGPLRFVLHHLLYDALKSPATVHVTLDRKHGKDVELHGGIAVFEIECSTTGFAVENANYVTPHSVDPVDLSIIIPTFQRPDLLYACVAAVNASAIGVPYEIIVVNNGDRASACDEAHLPVPVRMVQFDTPVTFGTANNIAAERARGGLLLLLNNDAFLTQGVVEALVAELDDESVGAAGPAFYYPDGALQELGGFVGKDGSISRPWFNGLNWDPVLSRDVEYISAACLLVRRADYRRVAGFDPIFTYYGEDVDLCLRLRLLGKRTRLVGTVSVVHIEGATSAANGALEKRTRASLRSIDILRSRWGRWLLTADDADAPNVVQRDDARRAVAADFRLKTIDCVVQAGPLKGRGATGSVGAAITLSQLAPTMLISAETPSSFDVFHLAQSAGLDDRGVTLGERHDLQAGSVDTLVVSCDDLPVAAPLRSRVRILHLPCPPRLTSSDEEECHRTGRPLDFDSIVTGSDFARIEIRRMMDDSGWPAVDIHVIPDDLGSLFEGPRAPKQNIVVSVGPLRPHAHYGGHDAAIRAFEELIARDGDALWRLVIVGDLDPEDDPLFVESLRERGRSIGVDVVVSPPRKLFLKLLGRAKVYLSHSGSGYDDAGRWSIASIALAISAGCVPVVFADSAEGELCGTQQIGVLFRTREEMGAGLAEAALASGRRGLSPGLRNRMRAYSESARRTAWNAVITKASKPDGTERNAEPTPALVLLGCDRSGASTLARALAFAGAALPDQSSGGVPESPDRFGEPADIAAWNDAILRACGSNRDDPFAFLERRRFDLCAAADAAEAKRLVNRAFVGDRPFILNDPLVSLLCPFWDGLLRDCGFRPLYIVMVRDPREVAMSLQLQKGSGSSGRGLLTWASYMVSLEYDTRDASRIFVHYNDLLTDASAAVARIQRELHIDLSGNAGESGPISMHPEVGADHYKVTETWKGQQSAPIRDFYRYLGSESTDRNALANARDRLERWLTEMKDFVT